MTETPASQDTIPSTPRPMRVVVVEDNALDAEIMVRELRTAGFTLEWTRVETEPEYLAALASAPDLILSDFSLPKFDGLRAVDLLVERELEIPFILISGTIGEEKAATAIQRGADDYLLKDRLTRLGSSVRNALEIRQTRQERKLTMAALHQSELAYRQLVHSLPIAMYSTDVRGRITLYNDAAVALWGRRPDLECSRYNGAINLFDLDGNAIPLEQWPTARVLRENRGIRGAEYLLERADGTRLHIMSYPQPICSEDGTLTGAVTVLLDVTELKQTQKALLASQMFAQATIDSVSAHICVLDETGKVVAVNRAWREFGAKNQPSPKESSTYLGANYLSTCEGAIGSETSQARAMAAGIRQVMEGTLTEFTLEYPCHSPTEQRWFLARVTRFRGVNRNVVVAHENVTERKLQELRVARLSRVQVLSSGINALIVRARDRNELFRDACEIAISAGGFHMAFVGVVDATGELVVSASAGKKQALLNRICKALQFKEVAANTMVMTAIREKTAIASNDSRNDSRLVFGTEYSDAGVRSLAILPLLVEGEAIGVFVLYSNVMNFFHDEEMKLLREMAGNIAFAIDHIKKGERLDYLAYYDTLTGLPNRTLFLDRVAQAIRSNLPGTGFSMVVLDLERFAQINDQLGRTTGDAVLVWVTERLKRTVGDSNLLMRVGDDQFAFVALNCIQDAELAQFLEKTAGALLEDPLWRDGALIRVAAKFGIACFPDDGADADTLLKHAKVALKIAKSSGQMSAYFSNELDKQAHQRLALAEQLRVAIDSGQLVLHYQPKVDMISGEIVGAEALIRWQHPDKGLLAPTAFIALAEETGLILPIGAWVIDTVCAQQAAWIALGLPVVPVAVNVSAVQLAKKDFLTAVRMALSKHAISSTLIDFELTESALMNEAAGAAEVLQGLRELGSGLALDDFGTGYSSPAYLKRFAFNSVKIDRSFITDITRNAGDAAIATAIIAMANSLHLKVVAEGVETLAQFNYLRTHGCHQIQGFVFSSAVPADVFASYLRSSKRMHIPLAASSDQPTLLLVDDEPHISAALFRMLRRDGYRILIASSGAQALELLATNSVQVIISDQRMPEMSGTEFLETVRQMYPDTIRMILSGYTDLKVVTESVNRGAVFKFLTKPWDDDELREHVRDAFRRFHFEVKH